MQNRIIRFSLLFALFSMTCGLVAKQSIQEAEMALEASFKSANNAANFPSMQLFSVADMKKKTYAVKQSKSLCLTRSASYSPASETVGSPAIQVVASTVIMDLNGQTLTKFVEDTEIRCVGIEVGYSPAYLTANSLTVDDQPSNIIIRNGVIDNFEVAIMVHKGVKNVRLENITITNSPAAIVMMGTSTANEEVASILMENCKVVGARTDDEDALIWVKAKVETAHSSGSNGLGFSYGNGALVTETNPSTGSETNAMYVGVALRYVNNVLLNGIELDAIGNLKTTTVGSDENSITRGFDIVNCHNLHLKNCTASHGRSGTDVVGCHIKSSTSVAVKNCEFNNNAATRNATVDIDTTNNRRGIGMHLESVDSVQIHNVECNKNSADSTDDANTDRAEAYGIFVDTANAIDMYNVVCTNNNGNGGTVAGLRLGTTVSLKAEKLFADYNSATTAARGLYLSTSAISAIVDGLSANGNISNGTLVSMEVVAANGCVFKNVEANYANGSGALVGIKFTTSANSVRMENISASSLASSGSSVTALEFSGVANAIAIANLQANNNSGNTAAASKIINFAGNANSVTIDGGALDNNSTTSAALSVVYFNGTAKNIAFKNLSCSNNSTATSGALTICNFAGGVAESIDMQNCIMNKNGSVGALNVVNFATSVDAWTVKNCSFNSNTAGAASQVLLAAAADTVLLQNVTVDNNSSTSGQVHGVKFTAPSNVKFDGVSVSNNTASSGAMSPVEFATSANSIEMLNVALNKNTSSSSTVKGLVAVAAVNMVLRNVAACYNNGSTQAIGLQFTSSPHAIDLIDVSCNANVATSSGTAYGLYVDSGSAFNLSGVSADYNQAVGGTNEVVGAEFATSITALTMKNVTANNNTSGAGVAAGIRMATAQAVSMDGVACNYNISAADKAARGMYVSGSLKSAHLKNISCDSNRQTSATSAGTAGVTYGLHIESPQSVEIINLSACKNLGDNKAHGLFLDGTSTAGSNIVVKDSFIGGNESQNTNITMSAVNTTVNISKHLPVASSATAVEGGFGVYVYDVDSCTFDNVNASKNAGARAGGMYLASVKDGKIIGCNTSYQDADGDFFMTDPFGEEDMNAISVPSAQVPTIFQDIATTTPTVDVEALTRSFLAALREIKYLHDIDAYDVAESSVYTQIKNLVASQQLLRAIMAQFRRFSTAVGLQLHACSNCTVEDHAAIGNSSTQDSAVGVGMSGTAKNIKLLRVNASGNQAWTESELSATPSIDISAVHDFWTALGTLVIDADSDDDATAGTAIASVSAADMVANIAIYPVTANQPSGNSIWDMDANLTLDPTPKDRLAIVIPVDVPAATDDYEEFGPAVGGEAIGILVGDAAEAIEISLCDAASNKGHAGKAFGLLQDVTTSLIAKDNRFYQTETNDFGYSFGACEMTLQSNSVHVGNVMFANAIGDNLNHNYLIPFDPAAHPNIYFPRKIAYNGDFTQFANASAFDNLIIEFVTAKQASAYAPTGMTTVWEDWIS